MDGFRRMVVVRSHSADHIPVSALPPYLSLKAAPTGLNLMAVTQSVGTIQCAELGRATTSPLPDIPTSGATQRDAPDLAAIGPPSGRHAVSIRRSGLKATLQVDAA